MGSLGAGALAGQSLAPKAEEGRVMNEARVIVLGLLAHQEMHGYLLRRAASRSPLCEWLGDDPELGDMLTDLVEEGLLARDDEDLAAGRPARFLYRLTSKGRQMLTDALSKAWSSDEEQDIRQEVAAYCLGALPADVAQELLTRRLDALREQEADLEEEIAGAANPVWRAVARRRYLRLQSDIAWVEMLIETLEQGAWSAPVADIAASVASDAAAAVEARSTLSARRDRAVEPVGVFTFVLHSHLPYCRLAGRWPHGEEWIHEAAAETYIPLLNALYDLRAEGVPYRLTLSVSPVLMEQLADADIRAHLLIYLDEEIRGARADILRFGEADDLHREYLATFYRDFYQHIKTSFQERFSGDLVGALKRLQDEGYVEISTCAATHGYLPLLARDASIYGQLRAAVESYRRHLGRDPRTIWLPECAYRPAYVDSDGTVRPALEEFLAPLGLTCFFAETHAVEGSEPVGKAAGEVSIGPYGAIKRRYVVPQTDRISSGGTTYAAYYVSGSGQGLTEPPVAVIGRNNRTGQQVWSGDLGYPGEADYREFHKKDDESGLQYWRVTGSNVDLGDKDYYHPDWAAEKVIAHAQHFSQLVEELASAYHGRTGEVGIISANYDTELFGHWWFEGIEWIKQVLRLLAESELVGLTTANGYLTEYPPEEVIALPESSWGTGGNHWTWDNEETAFMWPQIHAAERRMEELVARYPNAGAEAGAENGSSDALAVLNQAARELLLLQSSDWPFLVTTGQAKAYATQRFDVHLDRFDRLAALAEAGLGAHEPDARALADDLYHLDKLFPDIDYRWFASRQGRAE
jgi:1,4-alpha-glucan branching enzyme